jgi:hypothetical protein
VSFLQDASELYAWLLSLFRSPSLPLSEKLFHGGKQEELDSKVASERVLHLSLPPLDEVPAAAAATAAAGTTAASSGSSSSTDKGSAAPAPVTLEQGESHCTAL